MLDIFDILGPVMVGPSSSHTAGDRDPSDYAPVMNRRASCSVSCCHIGREP